MVRQQANRRRAIPAVLLMGMLVLAALAGGCADFAAAPEQQRTEEVGLLLRQQFTRDVCEIGFSRHLDILLPDHRLMGFNVGTDRLNFFSYGFTHNPGVVRDMATLQRIRPHYINAEVARNATWKGESGLKMITTWARFRVTPEQAVKLGRAWDELTAHPKSFRLLGKNCASRAAEMFVAAGILPPGLPGLDRPENVLKRVKEFYPDVREERGYFGFDAAGLPIMLPLERHCGGDAK